MEADVSARVQRINVSALGGDLEAQGWSLLRDLLTSVECDQLASLYSLEEGFRSRVVMARHGFGKGEYRYFSYPLPPLVQALRTALYPRLAPLANRWHERMGMSVRFPIEHTEFIARCAASGQSRPTPLLKLRHGVSKIIEGHRHTLGIIFHDAS
ncbi:MAG: 2OG-Fe(II) oxygenase [Caldimonas sp.]